MKKIISLLVSVIVLAVAYLQHQSFNAKALEFMPELNVMPNLVLLDSIVYLALIGSILLSIIIIVKYFSKSYKNLRILSGIFALCLCFVMVCGQLYGFNQSAYWYGYKSYSNRFTVDSVSYNIDHGKIDEAQVFDINTGEVFELIVDGNGTQSKWIFDYEGIEFTGSSSKLITSFSLANKLQGGGGWVDIYNIKVTDPSNAVLRMKLADGETSDYHELNDGIEIIININN